jgi:hypothetical protein
MKEAGTKVAPVGTRGSAHRHTRTYHRPQQELRRLVRVALSDTRVHLTAEWIAMYRQARGRTQR